MRRLAGLTTTLALVFLMALTHSSPAASPASGTVTDAPAKITYTGASISSTPPATSGRSCLESINCDTFRLTVDVPPDFYTGKDRRLEVVVSWTDSTDDVDLYICRETAGTPDPALCSAVGSSTAKETTSETVVLNNPVAGTYRITAAAFSGTTDYKGDIEWAPPPPLGPLAVESTSGSFSWVAQPVSLDSDQGGPSIDLDNAGRIFVAAPGSGVEVYRSSDAGRSFVHKTVTGEGGSADVELMSNDTGFTVDLRSTDALVSRSTDQFDSFTQQSAGLHPERPWLGHKCDRTVYLAYHDRALGAVMMARSDDGGTTWGQQPTMVSPTGSPPGSPSTIVDQGVNTFLGPVVVDQQTGDVYVVFAISNMNSNMNSPTPPFGDPTQVIVGVSRDGGATFELKLVKRGGANTLSGLVFPWITLDRSGNVYVSWAGRESVSDGIDIYLAHSTDKAERWSAPVRINQDPGPAHIFSTISGGESGVVNIAWYTGSQVTPADANNEWFVDFAQVHRAQTDAPVISTSRPYPGVIHRGAVCLRGAFCDLAEDGDRSLGEHLQIQAGPDGVANLAFTNDASPDGERRIWYARQTGGPGAGNGVHHLDYCVKTASTPPAPAPPPSDDLAATGFPSIASSAAFVMAAGIALLLWTRRREKIIL